MELALRAGQGDPGAFAAIVHRWERKVYRFVLVRLGSEHDAAEVTQETFLRSWRSAPRFRAGTMYSTWLFSIAHREAVNVIRRRKRDERDRSRGRELNGRAGAGDSAEMILPDVWRVARESLDAPVFEMVWLRYVEDLEPREIARVMGKSSVAVRVALSRARARLAEALEKNGSASGVLDGTD